MCIQVMFVFKIHNLPIHQSYLQGLVGAVFEGVGISLGSLVGGVLYDGFGGAATFRTFGIASLIACVIHAGVQWLMEQNSQEDEGKDCDSPKIDTSHHII